MTRISASNARRCCRRSLAVGPAPGLRLDYHDAYYAAFLLDPDGNRIETLRRGC